VKLEAVMLPVEAMESPAFDGEITVPLFAKRVACFPLNVDQSVLER